MSKPTIVKFTKPWNGYAPDEIAGFSAEQAERLIKGGVAELNGKAKADKAKQQQQQQQQQPQQQGLQQQSGNAENDAGDDLDDKKP